jgi:hypothetical protein
LAARGSGHASDYSQPSSPSLYVIAMRKTGTHEKSRFAVLPIQCWGTERNCRSLGFDGMTKEKVVERDALDVTPG